MSTLHTYLPQDRLRALLRGASLPDRAHGSALFADISGFTPLTAALTQQFGPRRGAEELTQYLDAVYTALITEVEKYGGSVVGFAGDAVTCWFADGVWQIADSREPQPSAIGDSPSAAVACALALQTAMQAFPNLALKVAVTTGPVRRLVVGDPAIQLLDTLAGATVARLATAEDLAQQGEVLLDTATAEALANALTFSAWRTAETGERFAIVKELRVNSEELSVESALPLTLNSQLLTLHSFLLPPIYERETSGQEAFLTEFRPCVALFVRFAGIDYDADHAAAQLNTFVQYLQALAQQYAGTLLNLTIGDKGSYAYLALGALTSHEDDARRAVKIALELRANASLLGFLAPLQIGITQGPLRVGVYGGATRRTYSALGAAVNLAARLMQAAAPGEILLSERMHKATAQHFVTEARLVQATKDQAEPLPVYAVLAERQTRAIHLQEPSYSLPMVGRQAELQQIAAKLDLALAGHAQVVGIVAEAGMGKSRLVAEVIRLARQKGFMGYGGVCQSDAIHTPYQSWKTIWSAFFGLEPLRPASDQIAQLADAIQGLAPERAQALPLLEPLLNLAIPPNAFTQTLEPQHRKSVLHALLQDCLRTVMQVAPCLLVIEDLHWIDALSHDLLEELAQALATTPICFVLAYRPPQLARLLTPRLEALPHFTKIELPELSPAESAQTLHAKLAQLYPTEGGTVSAALIEKIMARAQGNPFFLEELLNFLHDRGLDLRDATALEKIALPDSLHTLILSRIDQLSEREKNTLRVASIIGRLFPVAWLTGYYPALGDLPTVQADLAQLAKLDITPLDTPEPELAYLFKHIVTHEVTYESLPFAMRAYLHEQLALYLEKQIAAGVLTESAMLDALAYHYARSNNHAKQLAYLRKAAAVALGVSAFNTAVEYLALLVARTPPADPARAALALQLAEAHFQLGEAAAARAAVAQAQAAAQTDTDRALALAFLGEMASELGDYAQAQTLLAEAVPLARASGDQPALARALYALGDVCWRLDKLEAANAALNESLVLARAVGDVTRELFALNRLGTAIVDDPARAEVFYHEVYTRALAVGNRERAMVALNNLGAAAGERQDYPQARDYYQQALVLARTIGVQHSIALHHLNLADTHIQLSELATARTYLCEGLALAHRLAVLPWVVFAVFYFGKLAYAHGQTARALALWGLARQHPAWSSDHQFELGRALARCNLDAATLEAGLAAGAQLDWDATVRELLQQ